MNFTHLHVHTEYSLLDGSNKINEYVSRVKELGMKSAAITDHGVMFGCIDFYKAAKAAGIKPILGCEVYVAPGSRFDKEKGKEEDRYYHLVLLAENNQGYSNLMKIVSKGFVEGFYYKPRVDLSLLEKYHEGIIALSACLAGEVARNLARGFYEEGKEAALRYEKIFGKGNFFLELQDHGIPEQRQVNHELIRMSRETGIELVATNDVHYTYAEDVKPHDILLCLQTGKRLSDEDRMRYEGGQYYCKSEEEMRKLFPYAQEAIDNTHKIAERCNVEIEFGVTKLPKFDVPDGYDSWSYLNKLCDEGLQKRYPDDDGTLRKRLDYELNVIHTMGYVDYFLIVWDFINYARSQNIMVGPGRGSAAGSIVSYTLGITNIDPVRYNLLFERFLNPERVSMPDIDVDFCYERRQEVIDYVVRKYGKDQVVQIVTFGTLAAKGVVRDVGRVLDRDGNIYLENNATSYQALTPQTAYVMNRLLKNVLYSNVGTARGNYPNSSGMESFGKTGTASDERDLWFVGGTPYYVTAVWWGYDAPYDMTNTLSKDQAKTKTCVKAWKAYMEQVQADLPYKAFPTADGVVERAYCTQSGLLAGPNCPSRATGYYRADDLPGTCNYSHSSVAASAADTQATQIPDPAATGVETD